MVVVFLQAALCRWPSSPWAFLSPTNPLPGAGIAAGGGGIGGLPLSPAPPGGAGGGPMPDGGDPCGGPWNAAPSAP